MILIGENLHIISKSVKDALVNKDENFVKKVLSLQNNMDYTDLNIGPARGDLSGIFSWLCPIVEANSNLKISLDTTNFDEMKKAFKVIKNTGSVILNSSSYDFPKFDLMTDLAAEYDCSLVVLTMSKEMGIPKTCDDRVEVAFEIFEKCLEKGLSDKIYFDPVVLPVTAAQEQAKEVLAALKMVKEAFDIPVKTLIGLSNISSGALQNIRPVLNRVYAVLAFGAGLDAVILNAADAELQRILEMLKSNSPKDDTDKLFIRLSDMVKNFSDLEDVEYDKSNPEQKKIIKICEIFLNKTIYSNSFA